MSRIEQNDQEMWDMISSKCYADQAKWMLNGFWDSIGPEAENVWLWCSMFAELDPEKKSEGSDLDEFWSHKFLERLGETMTVIEMREKFRKIDADFNKRMSLVEFLMYRFSLQPHQVICAPQGDNKEGIEKAQQMVDAAQAAVDDMTAKLDAAQRAASDAKTAASAAKAAATAASTAASQAAAAATAAAATADEAAHTAEAAQQAADENRRALDELHAQEKEYEDKKAALTQTKEDQSLGVVRRNKAANELDQLLSEDPLPLRKAKIQQGATVKKSEKAEAAAQAAKAKADADAVAAKAAAEAAESARQAAETASQEAERAQAAAEQAEQEASASVSEAEARFQEALDFLEEEKHKGGIAQGDIWWMEREITEKKKYLPASRQK